MNPEGMHYRTMDFIGLVDDRLPKAADDNVGNPACWDSGFRAFGTFRWCAYLKLTPAKNLTPANSCQKFS